MTIVLKLPLTRAASTNGLQRYNGFWTPGAVAKGEAGGAESVALGNVADVGVVERLGGLGRCTMLRLQSGKKIRGNTCQWTSGLVLPQRCTTHPMELKKDITRSLTVREAGCSVDDVKRRRQRGGLSSAGVGLKRRRGDGCDVTCSWGFSASHPCQGSVLSEKILKLLTPHSMSLGDSDLKVYFYYTTALAIT